MGTFQHNIELKASYRRIYTFTIYIVICKTMLASIILGVYSFIAKV